MILHTKRLMLEPLGTKHYETTYRYSTDPENSRMMCFLPCDDGNEVMRYLKKCELQWNQDLPEYLDAAIINDGVHIGAVSIEFLENGTVGELGWIINKSQWGKGYAAEAAQCFVQYITEYLGVMKYIAHCDAENYPSVRVMEKLGMKRKSIHGGRKNRNSDEDRMEYLYEMTISKVNDL